MDTRAREAHTVKGTGVESTIPDQAIDESFSGSLDRKDCGTETREREHHSCSHS
jgi:hypothetical protein